MSADLLSPSEVEFIREAVQYLESPSYLIRVAAAVGAPMEAIARRVVPEKVNEVVQIALRKALDVALGTLPPGGGGERSIQEAHTTAGRAGFWHKVAAVVTGGGSGLFGLPGLAVELPLTTCIMFRSIAAIAASYGADFKDPAARLECLSIFSYSGPGLDDNGWESAYFTTRLGMAALIRDAAGFLAGASTRTLAEQITGGAAPVLLRYLARIAARFDVVVSQKVLAQSIPVVGVATGALINGAFTDHFNAVARYHFGLRKLERRHGADAVQLRYREILQQLPHHQAAGTISG